jgi:shikimate kinase
MSETEGIKNKNVYLVGPMGVGKTTIGKILADELNLVFIDTDREIELRTGADIPWIFDVEGEEGFRVRESRVLADLSNSVGRVLATGGGIVLDPANREIIKKSGFCVYLTANLEQLVSRVGQGKKRPLLQQGSPRSVLEKVLKLRDPLYRDVATWVVKTDARPPRQVASEIVSLIRVAA